MTSDVEGTTALYERMLGVAFGAADADLGQARVATRADGTRIGVRAPLAAHESPIVRSYVKVDDIARATSSAAALGATVAYGPTRQGRHGTFAIVSHGGVQHRLWEG